MTIAELSKPENNENDIEIIKSDNWELPVCNLGTGKYAWRPKTAVLPYAIFEGPAMSQRTHGLSLYKDLLIGVHGPRGSCKTMTLSFLIAKKMRADMTAWTNWPISFYVVEPTCWDICDRHDLCQTCTTGHKTYYESMPLNFDKLYTFNSEISDGVVGLTELQYYAESRTSSRGQNRILSYQLMQIRKSALSFFYDVQNPRWADNRFSWSDDVKIFCKDVSKMNYKLPWELQEGEVTRWTVRDISGVLTGKEYEETGEDAFTCLWNGWPVKDIYPTRWKVSVYDAVYSMKQGSEKADKDALVGKAMAQAIESFLEENKTKVMASDMWARASSFAEKEITAVEGGKVLTAYGVEKKQKSNGKYEYDISIFLKEQEDSE